MTISSPKVSFQINFITEKKLFHRNRTLLEDRLTLSFNHVRMMKRHSASILRREALVAKVKFVKNRKRQTLSTTKVLTCRASKDEFSIIRTTIIPIIKMSSMTCQVWISLTTNNNFTLANNPRWSLVLQTYPSIRTWRSSMNKHTIRCKKLNFNPN